MCEIWNAKRVKLQEEAVKAVLDLFEHTGADAGIIPIPNTKPEVVIVVGRKDKIELF